MYLKQDMFGKGRIRSLTYVWLCRSVENVAWSLKVMPNSKIEVSFGEPRVKSFPLSQWCDIVDTRQETLYSSPSSDSLIHVVFPMNLYRWKTALENSGTIPNRLLQRRQIRGHTVPTQCCCIRFSSLTGLLSLVDSVRLRGFIFLLTKVVCLIYYLEAFELFKLCWYWVHLAFVVVLSWLKHLHMAVNSNTW